MRAMRRLPLLALLVMGLSLWPATAVAERDVYFSDGCGKSLGEPSEVALTCADGKVRLTELIWAEGDGFSATATGLLVHPNLDDPSCEGKSVWACPYVELPVTVRVWRPARCPNTGRWQYTRLRATAPESPDPELRDVRRQYRCSEFPDDDPEPKRPRRLFVRFGQAEAWMRTALTRREVFQFRSGNSRSVRCRKRLSRDRLRCKMSWSLGDEIHFRGRGSIWVTYRGGAAQWNFSYRVTGVNEYCLRVGGSGCRKTWVVR
jgi:hypothetical protein